MTRFERVVAPLALLMLVPALQAADAPASDADILADADARIEKHRKADAVLKVLTEDGKPLPAGSRIKIEQTRHAFLFGSNMRYA